MWQSVWRCFLSWQIGHAILDKIWSVIGIALVQARHQEPPAPTAKQGTSMSLFSGLSPQWHHASSQHMQRAVRDPLALSKALGWKSGCKRTATCAGSLQLRKSQLAFIHCSSYHANKLSESIWSDSLLSQKFGHQDLPTLCPSHSLSAFADSPQIRYKQKWPTQNLVAAKPAARKSLG